MATPQIQVGDFGTVFRVTIKEDDVVVDVSAATEITFRFEKPDGSVVEREGEFASTGTDGAVNYTLQDGDIDTSGTWRYQVHVVTPDFALSTDVGKFKASPNLPV